MLPSGGLKLKVGSLLLLLLVVVVVKVKELEKEIVGDRHAARPCM